MATLTNDYVGPVGIARWVCRVMGVVFLIVAVWGFLSRDDMLMGLFMVNGVHNVVHLLSGAVLLALGFATESTARMGLWVFTAVYGLVMILGFLGVQAVVDLLHLNRADNMAAPADHADHRRRRGGVGLAGQHRGDDHNEPRHHRHDAAVSGVGDHWMKWKSAGSMLIRRISYAHDRVDQTTGRPSVELAGVDVS
jgi:hypothetical protein